MSELRTFGSERVVGPFNIMLEQCLLAAVLANPTDVWPRVAAICTAAQFYEPVHGRIFEAVGAAVQRGESPGLSVLADRFAHDEDLKQVGGGGYLQQLVADALLDIRDCEYQARELVDLWQRRAALEHLHFYRDDLSQPAWTETGADVIDRLVKQLMVVREQSSSGSALADIGSAARGAVHEADRKARGEGEPMISTGLAGLDQMLGGGLRAGQLIVLAGRPGMGKSSLALAIAMSAARHSYNVGFFSLEMTDTELAERALAAETGVPFVSISRGDGDALVKATRALPALEGLPIQVDDTAALTLGDLSSRASELQRKHGADLIFVDHLGLMRPSPEMRRANKVHQVEEITNGLKALAKRMQCPVVALCQLSRAVEGRDDKRPGLPDLRDSGSIEQDADVVMFVHREEYYLDRTRPRGRDGSKLEQHAGAMADAHNKADIIIGKNRKGATGSLEVFCNVATNRWGDLERGHA